jgi:manganese/iron transport system substrate-binding protein
MVGFSGFFGSALVRAALFASISFGFLNTQIAAQKQPKKVVVCSTTQVADLARNIVGDDWKVECVLGPGQDPHLYKATVNDANLIRNADLCLQNGWHLEGNEWMATLAKNANKKLVTCIDGVKPLSKEDDKTIRDPHAWMSPANAAVYVKNITRTFCEVDPGNAAKYKSRAKLYLFQLQALDNWIRQEVNQIPANRRVLVTHHDAFGYFCNAYGFVAKSPGSWTTEEIGGVSSKRRLDVVRAIRELGAKAIFVETTLNEEMMRQIAKDAGVKVGGSLYSDSMGGRGSAGETYIGMMRENVTTIVQALK